MASTVARVAERRTQPLLTDLRDELLEEIFLRLPTPAELARACTTRASFRRIITERSFLRRYRKRHPPPLLGFVGDEGGFHPAQAPHASAPLARALADAADFTYSFVPKHGEGHLWVPCDVRDGRVLLEDGQFWESFGNLAVCDPLFRRYALLPPIPENLALQEKGDDVPTKPLLMPMADNEDDTLFKVICLADYNTKLVAFLFSSVTGEWCIAATISWSSLGSQPQTWQNFRSYEYRGVSCFDCARGSYYSTSTFNHRLLVLDTRKMEFCTVDDRTGYHINLRCLPGQHENILDIYVPSRCRPGQSRSLPRIVVGREGALEMFSLVGDRTPNGSFDLYHTTQQNNSKEWQLENIIPLPREYDYFTVGAAEGFLFLGATTEDQLDIVEGSPMSLSTTDWNVDYFALDAKTSELTKVCRRRRQFFHQEDVRCYFGFPLSLSKPSI